MCIHMCTLKQRRIIKKRRVMNETTRVKRNFISLKLQKELTQQASSAPVSLGTRRIADAVLSLARTPVGTATLQVTPPTIEAHCTLFGGGKCQK